LENRTLEQIRLLHRDAIEEYGGDPGVRDAGLLESAIAQPRAMFGWEYLHRDVAEMAAAYLCHLAMNHAFVDGNKRIAAYAAGVFLDLNGFNLACTDLEFESLGDASRPKRMHQIRCRRIHSTTHSAPAYMIELCAEKHPACLKPGALELQLRW
jgi:death-on-curing protein